MLNAVIGVDLGSTRSVIAVAKKGHVEIITNEASNRENPAVVGYGQNERFIGEQGQAQKTSNFRNTVSNFVRFLGITPESSYLEQEKRYITTNLVQTADKSTVAFEVTYKGEKRQFTPVQITASYLQRLKQLIQKNGISNNEFVLSVPSYFTEQERKALLDACKIAEVNNLRLLNENAAVCLGYGIFRKADLDPTNSKNVIFVDFGHAKTSAYCASFTKDKFKILAQSDERNLGARDIDWILAEYYSKKFNDEHQVGLPINQAKPRLRLLEAIEKQRKVLSANNESSISCEYLIEDYDLSDNLNREQFEQLIQPVIERLQTVLLRLRDELQQKKILYKEVEIIGGATRIPIVQRVIQTVFGVQDLSRTLNASEAVAKGCVMMCAMNSSFFKVSQYGCEEYNSNPIRCQWIFLDPSQKKTYHYTGMDVEQNERNQLEKQRAILFDKGCSIPNTKSLTFNRNEPIQLSLYYDKTPVGAQQLIANYVIHPVKPQQQEHSIKIRVKLNVNQLIQIDEACLEEVYYEEIVVPKEDASKQQNQQQNSSTDQQSTKQEDPNEMKPEQNSQQQSEEVKKKKKTRIQNLQIDSSYLYQLSDKQIQQFFELEADMFNQDKITQEIYEKKNYLESYIYSMRGNLQDKYQKYTTPEITQDLLNRLQQEENWLYDEGRNAGKSQFQKKIEALKQISDPIEKRYHEYANLPEQIQNIQQLVSKQVQLVSSIEHLTEQEKQTVVQEANNIRQWLNNAQQVQQSLALTQDPAICCAEIQKKQNDFLNLSNPIVNKPKPQPPKQQSTEQQENNQNQQQQNTQMETEENGAQQQQQGEKMDLE